VVSYEPFHRSGLVTICPITTRPAKYPGEVPIPVGHAGQTKDGLILAHQLRTIDLRRVTAFEVGGTRQYVTDVVIRRAVRAALARHLGLDIPGAADGS
jgi:mRNA-degrading endonuclease toxin of MazEF toxin-antitoxin module